MTPEKKRIFTRITFLLNALIFLFGGIEVLRDGKITISILQFAASAINLLMIVTFRRKSVSGIVGMAVLLMNIVVDLAIAVDYFLSGSELIHYAWLLAALLSAVAFVIHLRRQRTADGKPKQE